MRIPFFTRRRLRKQAHDNDHAKLGWVGIKCNRNRNRLTEQGSELAQMRRALDIHVDKTENVFLAAQQCHILLCQKLQELTERLEQMSGSNFELRSLEGNVADIREKYGATIHKTKAGLGKLYETVHAMEKQVVKNLEGSSANADTITHLVQSISGVAERIAGLEETMKMVDESIGRLNQRLNTIDAALRNDERAFGALLNHFGLEMKVKDDDEDRGKCTLYLETKKNSLLKKILGESKESLDN